LNFEYKLNILSAGGLANKLFIADRLPAENQIPLLGQPSLLPGGREMNMNMSRAVSEGAILLFVILKPLVQVLGLADICWTERTWFRFLGKDVITSLFLE